MISRGRKCGDHLTSLRYVSIPSGVTTGRFPDCDSARIRFLILEFASADFCTRQSVRISFRKEEGRKGIDWSKKWRSGWTDMQYCFMLLYSIRAPVSSSYTLDMESPYGASNRSDSQYMVYSGPTYRRSTLSHYCRRRPT